MPHHGSNSAGRGVLRMISQQKSNTNQNKKLWDLSGCVIQFRQFGFKLISFRFTMK